MNAKRSGEHVMKMVSIMEILMATERDIGVREIAERCGSSKSTIHRILVILKKRGWVYQDEETGNYRIGVRFLTLADEWRRGLQLVRSGSPVMLELVERLQQTTLLSMISGESAVCLHKCESPNALKMVARVGKQTPLTAAATGKVLLAFAPEAFRRRVLSRPLVSYTPATITDPECLREELKEIGLHGYAVSVEEVDPGAGSIAVPVHLPDSEYPAALTIAGPRFDYEGRERLDALVPVVLEAGECIASRLPGKGEDPGGNRSPGMRK
ncbi:MAG: IclR family transcriptional regulator [Synergistales bacterium]|nr:IclR family transcriptional regulator [Synergistales bacterium]